MTQEERIKMDATNRTMDLIKKLVEDYVPYLATGGTDAGYVTEAIFDGIAEAIEGRLEFSSVVVFAIKRRDAYKKGGMQNEA